MTKCIDFVLAFPQADLDVDVFMELPIVMTVESGHPKGHMLRLNKSISGLKQSSLNWFKLLSGAMQKKERDFTPSQIIPCLFLKKDCAVLTYVDDILIIGKTKRMFNH
eukprot:11214460-Ditylum_brightwellii.AAC.1